MILTMQLMDRIVTAGCPDNGLVYDGDNWVVPGPGKYATLIYVFPTVVPTLGYPDNEQQIPSGYKIDTKYLCQIVSVAPGVAIPGVITQDDPLDGECLCLVCNQGTQLLNVKVE